MDPLLAFLAFPACWLATEAAMRWMLRPFRRAGDAHWTERARLLYPARISAAAFQYTVPLSWVLGFELVRSPDPAWLLVALALASAGVLAGMWPLARILEHASSRARFLSDAARRSAVSLAGTVVFAAALLYAPDHLGAAAAAWLAGMVAFGLLLGRLRPWQALRGGRPVPVPDDLRRLVGNAAEASGTRVRAIQVLESHQANAVADILGGRLAFSTALLGALTPDELASVVRHELAHLREPRSVVVLRLLSALWLHPWVLVRPVLNDLGTAGFLMLLLATLGVIRGGTWLARRLELRADQAGYNRVPEAPGDDAAYARALVAIHRANLMPVRTKRRNLSHPDLVDRLAAAGITPDFPAVEPAADGHLARDLATIAFSILLAMVAMRPYLHGG